MIHYYPWMHKNLDDGGESVPSRRNRICKSQEASENIACVWKHKIVVVLGGWERGEKLEKRA